VPGGTGASADGDADLQDGLAIASDWTGTLLQRIRCNAELTIAETKLAAVSFLMMLFLTVVAALFVLTAWGVLLAGATLGLQSVGIPVAGSLTAIGVVQLAAAVFVFRKIRQLSQSLELPATQAALAAKDDGQ